MFDYEAPIKIIMQEMQAQRENQVYQAIQNIGVDVDKEELLKALSYDRNQYEKGYRAAKSEIVHCWECKSGICINDRYMCKRNAIYDNISKEIHGLCAVEEDHFCSYGERKDNE